ncbi:MAG: CDP-alcohol phosphatidyltransferase family protein [Oscillospiraceae bacterium]|jgi:cardiolipin synthase|nr:CDP-alcohol phosphatidyltransferase family protein [Oscillospiraceae bacterium]
MMTIPNILSLIRLCVVPLVPLVYFADPALPGANLWAAGIYLAASLTDVIDGLIARKYNLVTRLGRVLDPLADKLMSFCVLVCIIIGGLIPFWAGVVFFAKETCMGLGALIQYRKINDVPPSNIIGKISTAFFVVVCFVILVFLPDPQEYITLRTAAISVALALNISAFILYMGRFIRNSGNQNTSRAEHGGGQE